MNKKKITGIETNKQKGKETKGVTKFVEYQKLCHQGSLFNTQYTIKLISHPTNLMK